MEPSCFIVPFGHEIAIAKFILFCLHLVDEGFINFPNKIIFLERFNNIIAPGFTPSFKKTGVYHKLFSYPEYGMFSKLFMHDESNYSKTSVINYYNKHWFNKYVSILWNRYKISRHLYNSGIVDYYNINGVKLYAFRVGDMKRFIDEKIKKDPLYLIT